MQIFRKMECDITVHNLKMGLCGEIIWCRSGEDVYMLHSSIRLADHTVWLQMDKKGNSEALHLKLLSKEGNEKVQQDEFQGLYISPRMQVKPGFMNIVSGQII